MVSLKTLKDLVKEHEGHYTYHTVIDFVNCDLRDVAHEWIKEWNKRIGRIYKDDSKTNELKNMNPRWNTIDLLECNINEFRHFFNLDGDD